MKAIRRLAYVVGRRPALAGVIFVVLPIILAACTNGGSGGSGY
jgi:hypothetical protein